MRELTLQEANLIVAAALDEARRMGLPPLCVVAVDRAGHVKAVQREDGASMFRYDVALGKAWASAAMGMPSRKLAEAAASNPNFFVSLAATAQGRFLPQTGAVLISTEAGEILGAVGASGARGDEDEAVCSAGTAAAALAGPVGERKR